jgi:transposase
LESPTDVRSTPTSGAKAQVPELRICADSVEKPRGCGAAIRLIHSGVKVHLALGYTDLRKGLDGLAILVQRMLELDTFSGHMFVFRGRRADLMNTLVLGRQRYIRKRLGGRK